MESPRSLLIDKALKESLQLLCINHRVPMRDLTVLVTFPGENMLRLQVCRKDAPENEIHLTALCCPKMVSLRFTLEEFAILLLGTHQAFKQENTQVSLLLYYSEFVGCVCIGILHNHKPFKALKLPEVIEAMHLGYEQLN